MTRNPRVHLVADDARSFLLASNARWDVILVDLVLPWTAGAGSLFARLLPARARASRTRRTRLPVAPAAPARGRRSGNRRDIRLGLPPRSALGGIPSLADAARDAGRLDVLLTADAAAMRARLGDPAFLAMARSVGLDDPDGVPLLYVTDGVHLRAATRDVPPITDDRPTIEFSAPRAYYHQEGLGAAALAWIAARLDPAPAPVTGAAPASFAVRADLLRAQLALLAGDGPGELRAYLDASDVPRRVPCARRSRRSRRNAGARATSPQPAS